VATMSLQFQSESSFKKGQVTVFVLLFNTLLWYFIGRSTIAKIGYAFSATGFENLCLGLAYPSSIIVSGIVASVFLMKIRKLRFFSAWLLFGVLASLCSAIPMGASFPATLLVTCMLGVSLGLGTPSCLSYFAEVVPIEKRGKVGGIMLFATILTAPFILIALPTLSLMLSAALGTVWRAWSLPFLFITSENRGFPKPSAQKAPSLRTILSNRTFYLYFVAWLMFALVDSFGGRVVALPPEYELTIKFIEPVSAGFAALVAGLLSDRIGRKRTSIFGFVSLGIAYATVGLFSQMWAAWFFYFIIDGIALGLLWTLFIVVLWGDIPESGLERYYAIGVAPFFLTKIFSLLLESYVSSIPVTSAFSLAAFFLFLAVLPLLYAPETLPEKKMKDRELTEYVKKAKKTREDYA